MMTLQLFSILRRGAQVSWPPMHPSNLTLLLASGHGAQTLDDMFQEFFHPAETGETKADSREDLQSQTTLITTSKPKSPSKTLNSERYDGDTGIQCVDT